MRRLPGHPGAVFADELRGEDVGRRGSRVRVLRTIPANGRTSLVAPADAARLRVGIVRYSPADRLLVAQKLTRKILADYPRGWDRSDSLGASWREIRVSLFCLRRGCEGVDDFGKSYYGQLLENAWYIPPTA